MALHRTAIFTLHEPPQRTRALLDRALAAYTCAYTAALHAFQDITPEQIFTLAGREGNPSGCPSRTPYRPHTRLVTALFQHPTPALHTAIAQLEYGVRESLREHVARTLLSYAAVTRPTGPPESGSDHGNAVGAPSRLSGEAIATTVDSSGSRQPPARRFPSRLRPGDGERLRLQGLQGFSVLADNQEEELRCARLLQHTAEPRLVPIPFCRIDPKRHCGLFYNPDTKHYYARLYVIPFRSPRGRVITHAGRYVDLRSGAVYMREEDAQHWAGIRSFGRSRASVMVLLETGRWHHSPHRFMPTPLLPRPASGAAPGESAPIPVCAKLVKQGNRYDLHVTFRLPEPDPVPTRTLLGLDRGLTCLAAGAVVSADTRQILETILIEGASLGAQLRDSEASTSDQQRRGRVVRGHARGRQAQSVVNAAANHLVVLAQQHQAQVVMEDLRFLATRRTPRILPDQMRYVGGFAGRRRRTNFTAMVARRQYQNLLHAVNARLALVGLPRVRLISPAYTSLTCAACGHVSAQSRSRRDRE